MTIKAITFDFWATLYKPKAIDPTRQVLELKQAVERASALTFEREQFEAAVKVARQTWKRIWLEEYRTISAEAWLSIMLNELDISLSAEYLFEIKTDLENRVFDDYPALAPGIKAVLANLSARYKLAVISDTGITVGRILRQLLEKDGLISYFDHLTFSDEVGYSKPHPKPFLTTLKALGVEPAEAVHIGDLRRTDIVGAKAVGMWTVQYTGFSHVPLAIPDSEEITIAPDAVIEDYAELEPVLARLLTKESYPC